MARRSTQQILDDRRKRNGKQNWLLFFKTVGFVLLIVALTWAVFS